MTGRSFITTQNHGYAVDLESLSGIAEVRMVNTNDGTCEGLDYPDRKCFTVQFHPEACAGPKDTEFLFERFIRMMEDSKHAQR
jgi:carbamoyl-phosphate synthase small subunit